MKYFTIYCSNNYTSLRLHNKVKTKQIKLIHIWSSWQLAIDVYCAFFSRNIITQTVILLKFLSILTSVLSQANRILMFYTNLFMQSI